MADKLTEISKEQRAKIMPRNAYNNESDSNNYTAKHTRATSDQETPERGRGTDGYLDTPNYEAGTQTDINGNPNIQGSGRNAAIANNASTWGYGPDSPYQTPDISENEGQVIIE